MTAPTTTPEITRYRDEVRAALADLSAEDRDDLMEDVESHLTEVAAEDHGSLARLGTPAEYAAELRTSAGLPMHAAPARSSFWARLSAALADSAAGRSIERVTQQVGLRAFLPELRPGWWVLRGYLVAWVIAGLFFGDAAPGLVPRVNSSALLGLMLMAGGIWVSVRLGSRAQSRRAGRARRVWSIAFTVALLLLTFGLLVSSDNAERRAYFDNAGGPQPVQAGLVGVSNVYVFDSEGRPLTGVQLFDQDGNPLQLTDQLFDSAGAPVLVRRHLDAKGNEVYNVFPREAVTGSDIGSRAPFIAPHLAPTAGPSAEPSPGASPSVAPSGGVVTPSATPSPR